MHSTHPCRLRHGIGSPTKRLMANKTTEIIENCQCSCSMPSASTQWRNRETDRFKEISVRA